MNKFIYFMAVGLVFTVLQVGTVEAADASCAKLADGSLPPHCQTDSNAADHESAGTGHHPAGVGTHAPALTIGDPLCVVAPALRDPGCPNAMPGTSATMAPPAPNMPPPMTGGMPPTMAPPHHDGPPPGEDCANKPTPEETAACWDQQGGHMDHPGDHPPTDMPPTMAPPHHDGHSPGEHHDGPPIDPRSGQPFTKADEDKFQKYADECEATQGLISQGSKDELIAEGFTAIMVDDLCKNGPQDAPPAGATRGADPSCMPLADGSLPPHCN